MSPKPQGNLYHLILGLPEEVTSPNHYELLGLDHRTGDSVLINNAAADQNRKLLHWQNSDRYAEVKALTFELVQAREVLLKEDSRTAYDASLGDWGLEDQGPWIVEESHSKTPSAVPLSVRCPECEAGFKLRNRDLIGRRIPCPECGFRFTVRPEREAVAEILEPEAVALLEPADSDAELRALDNFDDMQDLPESRFATRTKTERRRRSEEDYEDYDRRPRRSARQASRSSGKKAAIAGGVLMTLGCLVLAGIFINRSFSSSALALTHELAYLPPDCQTLGYYRIGDVSRSPVFQDHLSHSPQVRMQVDQFRGNTGMELQDLQSVVIGMKDSDPMRFQSLAMMPTARGLKFVAVARAAKDWDRSRLIGEHSESATHNNETYHTFAPDPLSPERWAFYLPDAKTLIFGSIEEVQAAIDTNGGVPNWTDVDFMQPDYPIINANVAGSSSFRPAPNAGLFMPPGLYGKNQGAGLMLSGHEVRQVSFVRFETPAEAARFVQLSEDAEDQRQQYRPTPAFGPTSGQGRTFTQHGLSVAVKVGGVGPASGSMLTQAASVPVALLARLGKPPAGPVNAQNPKPNPAPAAPPVANLNPGPRQPAGGTLGTGAGCPNS